ncbi:glycohydrolase toxin TNT-related protein [Buchananella felis]|uniref:glycohydrolase toxin TNT-related protein n=1 Tax=Buchananella felis TaxID=3231492 RepID=UPI0035294BD2
MADAIKRCADSLRALEAGASSRAESVTALLEQRDTLIDGIGKAEGRYRAAGDALETYSAALDRVQTDTLNALYAARQAKWERDEARDNQRYYQDLADDYASTDDEGGYGHDQQVRYTRLARSARQDADAAQDRIDNQVRVVENAVRERDLAAQTAIDAIQGVTATDGLNDGWWEDYGAKVLGWIATIAEWVAAIAGILALALCWVPVLGQALAVIAGIAGLVAALANIGLAIGGEKTWGEALLSIAYAGLGCIGLGGLRGAVSSLKALKGFGGALKAAGGMKGAFLTFGRGAVKAVNTGASKIYAAGKTAWTATSKALNNAAGRVRAAVNTRHLYVRGKTLRPGATGRDLLRTRAPFGKHEGRRIKSAEEWASIHAPNGETIYGPAAVEGTERTLSMSDYVEEFGHVIDRIGKKTGKWFSPVKDGKVYSFEARAVEEACKDLPYNQLAFPQELPDLQVRISQAAPNLGHPGGAIQLQLIQNGKEVSMADLIDLGVSKW